MCKKGIQKHIGSTQKPHKTSLKREGENEKKITSPNLQAIHSIKVTIAIRINF